MTSIEIPVFLLSITVGFGSSFPPALFKDCSPAFLLNVVCCGESSEIPRVSSILAASSASSCVAVSASFEFPSLFLVSSAFRPISSSSFSSSATHASRRAFSFSSDRRFSPSILVFSATRAPSASVKRTSSRIRSSSTILASSCNFALSASANRSSSFSRICFSSSILVSSFSLASSASASRSFSRVRASSASLFSSCILTSSFKRIFSATLDRSFSLNSWSSADFDFEIRAWNMEPITEPVVLTMFRNEISFFSTGCFVCALNMLSPASFFGGDCFRATNIMSFSSVRNAFDAGASFFSVILTTRLRGAAAFWLSIFSSKDISLPAF